LMSKFKKKLVDILDNLDLSHLFNLSLKIHHENIKPMIILGL
jgi:hypothetical protein